MQHYAELVRPTTTDADNNLVGKRYRIEHSIGAGSMGAVFAATDRLTGQRVALKRLTTPTDQLIFASMFMDSDTSLSLAHEFRTLVSLRHPNIISVLDYGFDEGRQPFFTMQLLEGGHSIREAGYDQPQAVKLDLLVQMLQALVYLHRRGILHRDLKPDNVLVFDGQVKVLDFGLATLREQTATDDTIGTLAYMSPEVLNGGGASIASDLYAVGVIAYELLAGCYPFDTSTADMLVHDILNTPPDLFSFGIEPHLILILDRLMAKTADERYADASDVIAALQQATDQHITLETSDTRESFLQAAQFVGREAEMAQLEGALAEAVAGHGGAWLVGGESGVGKSRLLEELRTQALVDGALVLRGQAIAEGGSPYQIWRDAIRQLSLQTELDDYEATILKLIVPDIEALIGRDVSDTPQVDAQSLQLRLLAVIEALFRRQNHLIVVLLEDLHWAKDGLILLKRLREVASHSPLLIIGTYRDDERPTLPEELPTLHHIKLRRLSSETIEQLSVSMLGEVGKSEAVVDLLKRETEGNVFFIVEVVRALAEEAGQLSDIGRKSLPKHVFAGGMQTVIRRRLDTVPQSARRVMVVSAVVGREIDPKILQVIMPALDMDDWLQQVATVIEVADNRYRFAHDKLRDAVLDALDADERRSLHGEVGQAIEIAYPESPEQYAMLAYHWELAQEYAKTIHYSILAGQDSLRSGSYRQAIRYYEHALALTEYSPLDRKQMAHLYYLLGDANWGQSDRRQSREWHTKALGLLGYDVPQEPKQLLMRTISPLLRHIARRLPRNRRASPNHEDLLAAAKSMLQMTHGSYHDANFALGLYCILNGIDAAERSGRSLEAMRLRVRNYTMFGFGMGDIALHPVADYYMKLAAKRLKQYPDPETQAYFSFLKGLYLAGRGRWDESNQLMRQAQQISIDIGSIQLWHEVSEVLIPSYRLQSQYNDAAEAIEQIAKVAIREDHIQAKGRYHLFKSRLLFMQGKTAEAKQDYLDHQTEIQAAISGDQQTISRGFVYGFLIDMYMRTEEWDAALLAAETLTSIIDRAQTVAFVLAGDVAAPTALYLMLWERRGTAEYARLAETTMKTYQRKFARHHEIGRPIYHTLRCWYLWLKGDEKAARKAGEQALQAARTYKMPFTEARAHFHLARFMAKDDPERAAHLAAALQLYEQVGAVYDAELIRKIT